MPFHPRAKGYTPGDIEEVFQYVSALCTCDRLSSPQKSDPRFRPPITAARADAFREGSEKSHISFHLQPDLRALYPVSTLAYYLSAPAVIDDGNYIAFSSGETIAIPGVPELETWAAGMLRRTFYLDCAVRYAAVSGGMLNGLNVRRLLGRPAEDIFNMGPGERLQLYSGVPEVPGLPSWHMAAYLDPVPGSAEALPYLMRALSAIYTPRAFPVSERSVVSMSIREFLGNGKGADVMAGTSGQVVLPSLREAGAHLWFSDGFPVDASKVSARSISGKRHGRKNNGTSIGIVCNEGSMSGEVDAIIDALGGTEASVEILWDAGVSGFSRAFARGFDVVQVIGHCDERGLKCHDGFAKVKDIEKNRTPMFFFNSCASYREAAQLVERGSVCGVATLFRVLEEAAVDVCRDFYRMLGAGYPVSLSICAARECSALGKEYLLVGDGSFACFGNDPLKPFYRIVPRHGGYSLDCTTGNVDKGYVMSSWSPGGRMMISDLGFETGPMKAEQLVEISEKFRGCCIYGRRIYDSVGDAALKAFEDWRCRT
jgi:hypothetical protein